MIYGLSFPLKQRFQQIRINVVPMIYHKTKKHNIHLDMWWSKHHALDHTRFNGSTVFQ